ncbi:MAG TPA: hypothetical protein VKH37_02900, partial [Ferruginibacter sp.]|nr:hypothetical protein [Ferruginibacter sp.]
MLRRVLEKHHFKPVIWNDSASMMLFDRWISRLDDEKIFLTKEDMAMLLPYRTKLDDELLSGKGIPAGADFFSKSTAVFRMRLQKADSIIQASLTKPLDFTKVENVTVPWNDFVPTNGLAQRWQQFLKWRVLELIAGKLVDQGKAVAAASLTEVMKLEPAAREKVRSQERADIRNLLQTPADFETGMEDEYLNAIAWCYDPHTDYMSKKDKKEFDAETSASEYSAGFDVEENDKGDKAISFLQPGGSAWRSGQLHKGDVLLKVKVDNVEKEVTDIEGSEELAQLLNGNKPSDIEISVRTTAGEL